eukprot:1194603-Prorocentrum_minimum.AAC.3
MNASHVRQSRGLISALASPTRSWDGTVCGGFTGEGSADAIWGQQFVASPSSRLAPGTPARTHRRRSIQMRPRRHNQTSPLVSSV